MNRWRYMFQRKKQDKTPEEELNEMKINNLSKKEFKIIIIQMLKKFRRRMDTLRILMQLKDKKGDQAELQNTITEIKKKLHQKKINSRLDNREMYLQTGRQINGSHPG